jgi:Transposase IS66 family
MIFASNRVRIMVATKPIDFRKGHDGLARDGEERAAQRCATGPSNAPRADHLPVCRQAQSCNREGVDLDRSTLADWVGRAACELCPVHDVRLPAPLTAGVQAHKQSRIDDLLASNHAATV